LKWAAVDDLRPCMFEPSLPRLAMVKSRISAEAWEARVEEARKGAVVLEAIAQRVKGGASLDAAIREEVPKSRRSWVVRHWKSYGREGFEGLIDERVPREPKLAKACGPLIEAARELNPQVSVNAVMEMLRKKVPVLPSESTIKLHFARVDDRRRYAEKKARAAEEVIELPLAGGELLGAAELETGAIGALTSEVQALAEEAREAAGSQVPEVDVAHRDERGHFTATYNHKRRRKRGEETAGYLRSAEEKAEGRVPTWPRFVHERKETLEPKLAMLTYAPLVSGTKGWDALRAREAEGLQPLTGFAYMPSTLSKMTSALAISGAGPRLLEAVGQNWHQVAQEKWSEPGAMAALYVDNQVKPVWSSLFTQSGKVSRLNRVMPCITNTFVQTGAGTPLLASVQSGTAPLAPRLVALVKEAEKKLDGDVRRAVVIDAEGSTFDILEAFTREERVIVTPLRPSRAPALQLEYSPGSYFRPYRENDELRVATAVLTHKSSGRSLEVGALLVRREHRENDTVLLTTGLSLGMEGRELADLYFARWPIQENAFKEWAAVGLAEHRGNCGRMVANVAVVTELERLESRGKAEQEERQKLVNARAQLEEKLKQAQREHQRAVDALATRRGRLDALVAEGRLEGKQLGRVAVEHQQALVTAEATDREFDAAQEALKRNHARTIELDAKLTKLKARRAKLEQERAIRQLDVALDSVLTAAKLTCALLITFALREYLSAMPMTPHTFVTRVFGIRGRRELRPGEERVVFYENPRDPEVNAALAGACQRLNQRRLSRDGRKLRYEMAMADGRPLD
jgi:hypothetical protein